MSKPVNQAEIDAHNAAVDAFNADPISAKIQKLAIAMEVELEWTPDECNAYETFEDARHDFLVEYVEELGYKVT